MKNLMVLLCLFGLASPALSAGWYVDAGAGADYAAHEDYDLEGGDRYTRVGIGYERSDHVAIEFGSLDLGRAEDTLQLSNGETNLVVARADGFYGAIKGTLRGEQVDVAPADSVFVRMGFYNWDGEACYTLNDEIVCDDEKETQLFLGVGFGFDLGPLPGTLNIELNYMQLDGKIDVTMLGASYTVFFWD